MKTSDYFETVARPHMGSLSMKVFSLSAVLWLVMTGCVSTTSGSIAVERDDEDAAELNYQLGARYYNNGNYNLARDRLELSLEIDPGRAIAWTTLALTYEQLGNQRLASESYNRAVRAEPRNFDVRNNYAVFLCRQGRFDEAREHFDRAAKAPTNDSSEVTLTNAGVCMVQKPDYEQAEELFRKALDRRPNHPEALLQLTVLKYRTEDYLGARAFLQRFLVDNEASAAVLFLGVQIEDKLGNDRARGEYREQIQDSFPNSPEAQRLREIG